MAICCVKASVLLQDDCRKSITDKQEQYLEKTYSEKSNPSEDDMRDMCEKLRMSYNRVLIWFRRRRRQDRIIKAKGWNNLHHIDRANYTLKDRQILQQFFDEEMYPLRNTTIYLGWRLNVSRSQIENWFINMRKKVRRLNGEVDFFRRYSRDGTRMYFTKAETKWLLEQYNKSRKPRKAQEMEMAKKLNTSLYRIKAWFRNKRKTEPWKEKTGRCYRINSKEKRFTREQHKLLIKAYSEEPYPNDGVLYSLGRKFGMPRHKIQTWFNNMRHKEKAAIETLLLVTNDTRMKKRNEYLSIPEQLEEREEV